MSSFFSRTSTKSASSSITSTAKGKEAPPPTHHIFTSPPDGVVPKKKWEYNEAQLKQISELKEYTSTLILPTSDPYHPWESRFLADPGCHPRYMRAAKWKLPEAKQRIKGTIEWRREYKPELISPDDVGIEAETGKIILTGFDVDARPILYMRPGRENTETSPRQIRHLIYHLERAIDLMPPGQEQVAIIVDYKSATSQSNPSIGTARKVLNILQNHYVERLGRGLVVNMSWWINAFFSGISPFLDPITRDKIRFNPKLPELVPIEQLDYEFGGEYHLEYDYKTYWKIITEFCHLASDGTRTDNNGNVWYPPLGNGVKAASEGLVPKIGAVQTGEIVPMDHEAADPKIVHLAGGVTPEMTAQANGDGEAPQPTPAQLIAEEAKEGSKEANGAAGSEEATLVAGVEKLDVGNGNAEAVLEEPPTSDTKPGAPEGEVVFDHPPSKGEIKEAQELVEAK